MFRKKKVIKNSLFVSGSQIIGRAIGFGYFIILARILSVEDFGILAWVLGFVYNFFPLADFGLERLVLKEISRNPKKRKQYLSKLVPLRLIMSLIAIFTATLAAKIIGIKGYKLFLVFAFSLSVLPYNLIFLFTAFQNAREKMRLFATAVVGTSALYTIFGLIFFRLGLGLSGIFTAYFFANSLILFWMMTGKKGKMFDVDWSWDFKFWRKAHLQSWVFALFTIAGVFYLRTPLILVGKLLGDYQAGIYGAASKFIEAGILVPQGIALALFPAFSKIIAKKQKNAKKRYLQSLKTMFLISLPIGVGMMVLGKWLIPFIYGDNYQQSGTIFALFGPVMILFFVNSIAGNVILSSKKVKRFVPYSLANLMVALIAGLILIPKFGPIGGAWTLLIGELFGVVVNNWFALKVLSFNQK